MGYSRGRPLALAAAAAISVLLSTGAVTAASAAPAAAHTADRAADRAADGGWQRVLSTRFDGPAGFRPWLPGWTYAKGSGSSFGNNQVATMTDSPANVSLDGNGHLNITPVNSNGSWTSGRLQTSGPAVSAPAGGELEVTASIRQPDPANGTGYWPGFWLRGTGPWPQGGEVDIMESVNARSQNGSAVHCGGNPGGPCNEPSGLGGGLSSCGDCQSAYHDYSVVLDRTNTSDESITFYLDGRSYFSVREDAIGAPAWQAAFDGPMSIILNLAIGGDYPDELCGCTSPVPATTPGAAMSVAHVAAYTSDGPESGLAQDG